MMSMVPPSRARTLLPAVQPMQNVVLTERRTTESYELGSAGDWRTSGATALLDLAEPGVVPRALGSTLDSAMANAARLTTGSPAEIGADRAVLVVRDSHSGSYVGYEAPVNYSPTAGARTRQEVRDLAVRQGISAVVSGVRGTSMHVTRPVNQALDFASAYVPKPLTRVTSSALGAIREGAQALTHLPGRVGVSDDVARAARAVAAAALRAGGVVADQVGAFRHRSVDVLDVTSTIPGSTAVVWRGEANRLRDNEFVPGMKVGDVILTTGDSHTSNQRPLPHLERGGSIRMPPTNEEISDRIKNMPVEGH